MTFRPLRGKMGANQKIFGGHIMKPYADYTRSERCAEYAALQEQYDAWKAKELPTTDVSVALMA